MSAVSKRIWPRWPVMLFLGQKHHESCYFHEIAASKSMPQKYLLTCKFMLLLAGNSMTPDRAPNGSNFMKLLPAQSL